MPGQEANARQALMQLKDAGILQTVTPGDVLAKQADPDVQQTNTVRDQLAVFRAAWLSSSNN